VAVALSACGVTKPVKPADLRRELVSRKGGREELSVLFIGNSYSFGAPKAFEKLAESHGKRVIVDQVTHNGWTLARHAENEETLGKLHGRHWDVVVLQEESRTPAMPLKRAWMMVPAVRELAAIARKQGGIPLLYQTWGRRDGDPRRPGDDFHAMNGRVREGYRLASVKAGGLAVLPAGDAWEREVSAGRGDRLFQPDGSHPTRRGDMLTAGVFYDEFFGK
jgi:hypothetical protein